MRGWASTLIIVLCCAVAIALYIFLFQNQMNKKLAALQAEDSALDKRLADISRMEADIPRLRGEVPMWRRKVQLYEAAIPPQINDDVFFRNLAVELKRQKVDLLSVELSPGGPWLGDIKEEEAKRLEGIGIDVETAKKLKVAFYSIKVDGKYDAVLSAFENVKSYRRIYGIDEVMGPAGTGGGMVTKTIDASRTPIEISGKIFYGIPPGYISDEQLRIALQAAFMPVTQQIFGGVRKGASSAVDRATSSSGAGRAK